MKNLILKNLNGRKIIILFIFTNIIYSVMMLITIPKVMDYAGGMKILDIIPNGYNFEYVNSLLHALGSKGRHAYLYCQLPIDMIYPLFFGVTYSLITAYILNKLNTLETHLFYLCCVPLLSGLCDYLENIGIITILNRYPENSIISAQLTSIFSVAKSIFTITTFIILTLLLSVFIIKFFLKKKTST